MNTKDEALKLALEALVYAFYEDSEYDEACAEIVLKAKTAIKEALAQPEQETKEQRLLRRKWFGHRDTEHLSFAEAVDATMEKLYSQPEQSIPCGKPVAWSYWQSCLNDDGTQTAPWVHRLSKFKPTESIINKDVVPLYTDSPKRKPWVGLTDEEIDAVTDKQWSKGINKPIYAAHRAYARAIEAKLEKENT